MKIMLADDELSLCDALEIILDDAGYEVCIAHDGAQAIELFRREQPDLVVLDVMMPKYDGFEVCEVVRGTNPDVPLLMLSAKGDIVDKKSGFKAGADDYLVKPFNDEELLLRIEALMRRRSRGESQGELKKLTQTVQIGDLVIDPLRYEVTVADRVISLTPKEFQILALMADHPGKVFTREDLIENIWGKEYEAGAISIPVYVRRIREKIEEDPSSPKYLQTVWRFGYRLGD
ncbi:response regulator transcription factor [Raoultibacter timonensis]|uniref:response regulator transcription factor n=1 Tax=Raoultibacter timonensis TaxID=1907662 RepID=UPI000C852B46|nr:response regulator transcription factor [Raoultibacter timonensis]